MAYQSVALMLCGLHFVLTLRKVSVLVVLTVWLPLVTKHNFSLQYQYNIKQTIDGNEEKYPLGIISWSNTTFSEPASTEMYGRQ